MNKFRQGVIFLLTAAVACQLAANEIYKSVDEDGNVVYSDAPPADNAAPVALPDLNVQPSVTPRVRLSPDDENAVVPISVEISHPQNETVVNPGALSFAVTAITNRALLENETAQLLVNGTVTGEPRKSLNWSVGNLIRGEYQVQVQVMSAGQVQTTSNTVKVFVQRAFIR